jgi:hypothetical protein
MQAPLASNESAGAHRSVWLVRGGCGGSDCRGESAGEGMRGVGAGEMAGRGSHCQFVPAVAGLAPAVSRVAAMVTV